VLILKVVPTKIDDLQEGFVLGKDLYVENRMLMKKGSVLTARILTLLKNRNVQHVYIEVPTDEGINQIQSITEQQQQNPLVCSEWIEMPKFLQALAELSTERRYGHALKNMDDIVFVRDLFETYMQNLSYRRLLQTLKKYDEYTFMHAIDVFTLATLFAKKEGISHLKHYALGFLFHDIGKLNIPYEILSKEEKLTVEEFATMQKHTQFGYDILKEIGLESIAILAKLHHERIDGSGYPEGLAENEIPKEVLLLQLIDIYSAVTMNRPYKQEIGAAEAMATIYKEKHLLDEKLLAKFVDFIGIYPEKSIVLLSDGTHALVEHVNNMFPLLPTVRRLDTNTIFDLPVNFQLKIEKLITYYVETPDQLFRKFSEYLIKGEAHLMEKYYHKLIELHTTSECITKIYIPVYQIFDVLKEQVMLENVRVKLRGLLNKAILQLRKGSKTKTSAIFLVDQNLRASIPFLLLEGVFYVKEICPIIIDTTTSKEELLRIADYCKASAICSFEEEYNPLIGTNRKLELYHITTKKLDSLVFSFAGLSVKQMNLKKALQKYKAVTKMINN